MEQHRFGQRSGISRGDEVLPVRPKRIQARSIREILKLRRPHPIRVGPVLGKALPSTESLARELCSQRGFDIKTLGVLPSECEILCVESLNFDKALVLLSLIPDARVYSERSFSESNGKTRALSLRVFSNLAHSGGLGSIVSDLANQRVVVADSTDCMRIQQSRSLLAPIRHVHVDQDDRGVITVEVEPASQPNWR